jgi:hypothetical protein
VGVSVPKWRVMISKHLSRLWQCESKVARDAGIYVALTFIGIAWPVSSIATPTYSVLTITDSSGGEFGEAIASIGDINGDAVSDFAIGAPNYSPSSSDSDHLKGRVKVFSGSDRSLLHTITGSTALSYYGFSLSGIGDLNGDGTPDLLVGAPGKTDVNQTTCPNDTFTPYGKIEALSGSALAQDTTTALFSITGAANSSFGSSVIDIGNIAGSSVDDFVVSSPADHSNADPCATVSALTRAYTGGTSPSLIGSIGLDEGAGRQWALGDVNGDSVPDFATYSVLHGNLYIISGSNLSILSTITISGTGMYVYSVASLGDINGDGYSDIAVGLAESGSNHEGAVKVYHGNGDGTFTLAQTFSGGAGDHLGTSITNLGDIDGDGKADFAVVATGTGKNHAYVRLFSGGNLGGSNAVIGDYLKGFDPGAVAYVAGSANLGDLDGDGKVDFAVGPFDGGTSVYLFLTNTTPACNTALPLLLDNRTVTTSTTQTRGQQIVAGDLDGNGTGYDIQSGSTSLTSGSYIELDAGFTVESGASLAATIGGC